MQTRLRKLALGEEGGGNQCSGGEGASFSTLHTCLCLTPYYRQWKDEEETYAEDKNAEEELALRRAEI